MTELLKYVCKNIIKFRMFSSCILVKLVKLVISTAVNHILPTVSHSASEHVCPSTSIEHAQLSNLGHSGKISVA